MFYIEKTHPGWFDHESKTPQQRLHKQILCSKLNEKRLRPVKRPKTSWLTNIQNLGVIISDFFPAKHSLGWQIVKCAA